MSVSMWRELGTSRVPLYMLLQALHCLVVCAEALVFSLSAVCYLTMSCLLPGVPVLWYMGLRDQYLHSFCSASAAPCAAC